MTGGEAGPGPGPRRGQTENTAPEKNPDHRDTRAQAQTSGSEENHGARHATGEAHLNQTEETLTEAIGIEGNLMTETEDNRTETEEKKGGNLLVNKKKLLPVKSSLKKGGRLLEAEGREKSQLEIEDNHTEATEENPMKKGRDYTEENKGGNLSVDKERVPTQLSLKKGGSLLGAEGKEESPLETEEIPLAGMTGKSPSEAFVSRSE